jgi:hypothetical protein
MSETGWPLIPREVLPAPVPAAKARRRHVPRPHPDSADPGRQLPFFGAETTEPSPADLVGLLAGPGRLGRMGGTARVSVEVDAAWRVHVLVAELVARGLATTWRPLASDPSPEGLSEPKGLSQPEGSGEPEGPDKTDKSDLSGLGGGRVVADQGHSEERAEADEIGQDAVEADETAEPAPEPKPRFEVLTAYSRRLNGLARGWPEAAAQLFLSGPRLRLWVAAAGEPTTTGYALGLDPARDPQVIDAALVRAGLAGRLSADGRHYLIIGRRRLRRLAELVGERPAAAPDHQWPGGAGA